MYAEKPPNERRAQEALNKAEKKSFFFFSFSQKGKIFATNQGEREKEKEKSGKQAGRRKGRKKESR